MLLSEKTVDNIIQSRAGGKVERSHCTPHHGSYSVAAHSWGVAMLMYYLWPEEFPRLVIHCLVHDVPEAWVGDIPYMSKVKLGASQSNMLYEMEQRITRELDLPTEYDMSSYNKDHEKLRACDLLEFYLWAREQMAMGNSYWTHHCRQLEMKLTSNPLPEPANSLMQGLMGRSIVPNTATFLSQVMNDR